MDQRVTKVFGGALNILKSLIEQTVTALGMAVIHSTQGDPRKKFDLPLYI